jgi:hypothetical protein
MIRYVRFLWRNIHNREELNEDLDEELRAYFAKASSRTFGRSAEPDVYNHP